MLAKLAAGLEALEETVVELEALQSHHRSLARYFGLQYIKFSALGHCT